MERDSFNPGTGRLEVVLTHDGSRTLRISGTSVTYHSTSGAATESREVFLRNSGLLDPEHLRPGPQREPFRIFEIGFGTGMTFLLAADWAIRAGLPLHYTALDRWIVPAPLLRELGFAGLVDTPGLAAEYEEWIRSLPMDGTVPCQHCWKPAPARSGDEPLVRLNLCLDDYGTAALPESPLDAIFLDAFAPAVAPEPWTFSYLSALTRLLAAGGKLVTWCVQTGVQKSLRSCGLDVRTVRGPAGGKREVLIATAPREAGVP